MLLSSFPPRLSAQDVISQIESRLQVKNDLISSEDWETYYLELSKYSVDEGDKETILEGKYNDKILEILKRDDTSGKVAEIEARTTQEYKDWKHQQRFCKKISQFMNRAEDEKWKRKFN